LEVSNFFAERAGLETTPIRWKEEKARGLGYVDAETGLATEYMAIYDALMAGYGKDEFLE